MADACSQFENLDPAILICILSACHSADDLWACIRVSRVVYQCFSRYRKRILLRINFNLLSSASAIRDLVFISRCGEVGDGSFQSMVETAVCSYRHLKLKKDSYGDPLAGDLDWNTIAFITRRTRAVCYVADLYVSIRFRHFGVVRKRFLDTLSMAQLPELYGTTREDDMDWEKTSATEKERITSALIRLQLAVDLGGHDEPLDLESFLATIFPLFNAWEWEQISELDSFLSRLIRAMLGVETLKWSDYDRRCVESTRTQDYFWDCHQNPELLYKRLTGLLEKYPKRRKRILWGKDTCALTMEGGGVPWVSGSHSWEKNVTKRYLPIRGLLTESMRRWGKEGDDHLRLSTSGPDPPPWAWYIATGGRNFQYWGISLKPKSSDEHAQELIELWRWSGMVFWDKDRADLILQTRKLKECSFHGWLYVSVTGRQPRGSDENKRQY